MAGQIEVTRLVHAQAEREGGLGSSIGAESLMASA